MINHLWIIMDWNRRWAKARLLPSFMGHKAGFDNVRKIVDLAIKKNIKYLTFWALSVDNLEKREEEELQWLIKLINKIWDSLWELLENKVKFQIIWDIWRLPKESQEILNSTVERTKQNESIIVTIALVYWWQDEIIRATKKIIKAWIDPETLTREEFRKYLDISILPKPDLIVRTWCDIRHSWFLLFDSEYSEYYFSEKKWPEFDEQELDKAIEAFWNSRRNFWK